MAKMVELFKSPAGWLIGLILITFIMYLIRLRWLFWDIGIISQVDSYRARSLRRKFLTEIAKILILLLVSFGIIFWCCKKPNMEIGLIIILLISYLVVFFQIYNHEEGQKHRGVNKQEENISLTG